MLYQYLNKLSPLITKRNIFLSFLLIPPTLILFVFISEDNDEFIRLGRATYSSSANQVSCTAGSMSGESGVIYGETTEDSIKYNVRTPSNYDPKVAHPLLMVYAPAGANRARTEKLTGLSFEATKAGFIVAYADHQQLSPNTTVKLGKIPGIIAKKWCIDDQRIFLTGHSDGGTVSMALAFMAGTKDIPAAIAPSAVGIRYSDLNNRSCPEPISVMIMHSSKDRLFPGYGEEALGWWAACNDCGPIPEKIKNGCIAYTGCANDTKTWYCEGNKSHSQWPAINSKIIEFFSSAKPKVVYAK